MAQPIKTKIKRIAWLTDIHLEFLEPDERAAFVDHLAEAMPDIMLVGGNTGIASNFDLFLQILQTRLKCPIYFVLGNHDFYRGAIAKVRAHAEYGRPRVQKLTIIE